MNKKGTHSKILEFVDSSEVSKVTLNKQILENENVADLPVPLGESDNPISLVGNIENFENGYLSGWALDESNPHEPVKLRIYERGKVIGECIADQYRKDLISVGVGTGLHGFRLLLENFEFDSDKHELHVAEAETSTLLGRFDYFTQPFATSTITAIEGDCAVGMLTLANASGDIEGFDMELLVDGSISAVGVCSLVEGLEYSFRIPIPSKFKDNTYHVYSAQLKGLLTKSNLVHDRLLSIRTPWKYLCNDITSQSLSTINKLAGYRYESLQAKLRNAHVQPTQLENLMTAHDVVVQGFEERKSYPKLRLPDTNSPQISIIIPTYNTTAMTYNCIASVILSTSSDNYEVIVIDDDPNDRSTVLEDSVENLRFIKNQKNLGFLNSCNKASNYAKGDFIVLLNSDTEVTCGWLENLKYVFECFDGVGLVGSKLVYPDGQLQEAGGIVWGNGKPWNVGNGMNPDDPQFCYTRQVDYLSAAAVMIKKAVWNSIGKFSEEFLPAYYEDTDLAFKVREAGYRTFLCADSVVIHYEGKSNGTDTSQGVKSYQSLNAPKFRSKWRRAYKHNGTEGADLHLEKDRNIDFRVLMIDFATPCPDQDAGGYAAIQEMAILQELGCKITFLPNNLAHMGSYTHYMQRQGIECIHAPFYLSSIDFIKDRGKEFDLVYITRYDVAEDVIDSVRKYSSAKIVLNNADLHFLRELRVAVSTKNQSVEDPLRTRERELKVMKSVDAVLSYNDVEHSVIASHNMVTENIFKCPWVLTEKPCNKSFSDRTGIAFLGGFNHFPNKEAVTYFSQNIMPKLLVRMPELKFYVYGSKVTEEIQALENDSIEVVGYVETLSDVFDNCRVFVAPLLSGAGIKGKVLESISYSVPSVLSPIAAESTGLVDGVSAFIAKTDDQWVDGIEKLYTDKNVWEDLSNSCGALTREIYSFESGLESMARMMSFLELDPSSNRSKFFNRADI